MGQPPEPDVTAYTNLNEESPEGFAPASAKQDPRLVLRVQDRFTLRWSRASGEILGGFL